MAISEILTNVLDNLNNIWVFKINESSSLYKEFIDEFIKEVERLIEMPQYREMTFRIVAKDMHRVLNGSKGRAHWKEDLAGLMDINK